MKRLYACKAYCDKNTLKSYNTLIYSYDEQRGYTFNCVRTTTTLQHIRKYIKWLREQGEKMQAMRVEGLYKYCIKTGKRQIVVDFLADQKRLAEIEEQRA